MKKKALVAMAMAAAMVAMPVVAGAVTSPGSQSDGTIGQDSSSQSQNNTNTGSQQGFFRNYPFLCFPTYLSFASNKRFLQRPYIVRFIIFNRLFVPSTKPLL